MNQTENKGNSPQTPLRFQAITPGLGFHPFSDGLPYAPVSKSPVAPKSASLDSSPSSAAAGAIAAGSSGFRLPAPRVSVPVAAQPVITHSSPVARSRQERPRPPIERQGSAILTRTTTTLAAPRAAAPSPSSQLQTLLSETQTSLGFGYLLKRVVAFFLDSALNCAVLAGGLSLALWNQNLNPDLLMNPGVIVISTLFFALFNWALITAQEIAFGTTAGKRVFRLALHGTTSAIFLRAFFFLPSFGFCGIGLLWSLLDRQKRCWHDLVVNVQPIEIARI